ncbi:epidermal growth factor-like protein [Achroia grisella]|uniref:epidermal growth factor-like protein n=1 Tax=Achroia grisella TaxID=688607 RepID=UPI0027D2F4E2|nr:epidermal growth factor-like protein [Achroia grisella]
MIQFAFTHVLVILIFLMCNGLHALKTTDDGVCVRNVTTSKLNKYGKRVKHISTVPHCCTGWNYDAETDGCKPAVPCNGLCVNSKCGDNDVCECNSGHRRVNETHCAPECPTHFVNDPYTLKCICEHGYKWSANETKCLPVCEEECENGECVAPNECTCHSGYEFQSKYKCKPVCSICENGECISPNVCVCSEGYTRKGSKCIPVCEEECVNGFCIVPNICECGEGYRNNLTAPHICYKPCNNICNYGNCDLHGRCICDAGFKFDGDSCKLIKTDEVNKLSELSSNKTLASLQLSWILAGVVILLLVTLGVVIMQRIWQKTKKIDRKPSGECKYLNILFVLLCVSIY